MPPLLVGCLLLIITCTNESFNLHPGLAIASRFPFEEVEFTPFSEHGDGAMALVDAEVLARKGVGRVRVWCRLHTDYGTCTCTSPQPILASPGGALTLGGDASGS